MEVLDTIGIHLGNTNICISYAIRHSDDRVKIEILQNEGQPVTPVILSVEDGGEEHFNVGYSASRRQN